jgi:twinkle protein
MSDLTGITFTKADVQRLLDQAKAQEQLQMLAPASEFLDKMLAPEPNGIRHPAFGGKLEIFDNELTIWAGAAGSGKSMLLGQFLAWEIAKGYRGTIASMEMPPHKTLRRMHRQCLDAEPTEGSIKAWLAAMEGHLWLYRKVDSVATDEILAMTRVAIEHLGCQHVVIDSLTKVGIAVDGPGALTEQTRFVDRLQDIVKNVGGNIHLVAHIRKPENGKAKPSMHDVRGASQITDLADNVVVLARNRDKEKFVERMNANPGLLSDPDLAEEFDEKMEQPDARLLIEKQRETGGIGEVELTYHQRSGQFIPHGQVQAMPWKLYN